MQRRALRFTFFSFSFPSFCGNGTTPFPGWRFLQNELRLALFTKRTPAGAFYKTNSGWRFLQNELRLALFTKRTPAGAFYKTNSGWRFLQNELRLALFTKRTPAGAFYKTNSGWRFLQNELRLALFTKRTPAGRVGLRQPAGRLPYLPHIWSRYTSGAAATSVNIRFSTSLARWATPADENGRPNDVDTLLLRRVGTGCEPVIRIVKEPWRLSPVAFRCLSTASVLHLEEHFRGKDHVGRSPSQGRSMQPDWKVPHSAAETVRL